MRPVPDRVQERYLNSLSFEGKSCLVSSYSTGSHGYTQIGWVENGERVMELGHRVAWFIAHGPVPDDMTIDHICRNRRCGRVDHLRLLSNVDNAKLNGNAVKTHCKRGHEFTEANTYRDGEGHRRCRTCIGQKVEA